MLSLEFYSLILYRRSVDLSSTLGAIRLTSGAVVLILVAEDKMIQCRLRELMAAMSRQARSKITYDVINETTGLAKSTLARLANDKADLIGKSTMDRLCAFFDCQPGDLFVYVPASQE